MRNKGAAIAANYYISGNVVVFAWRSVLPAAMIAGNLRLRQLLVLIVASMTDFCHAQGDMEKSDVVQNTCTRNTSLMLSEEHHVHVLLCCARHSPSHARGSVPPLNPELEVKLTTVPSLAS